MGAAIFDYFESEREAEARRILQAQKLTWRQKYNISEEQFDDLTEFILKMKSYKLGKQWKFAGAFYFVTTVITTIGKAWFLCCPGLLSYQGWKWESKLRTH